jgi:NADH-quinone oxidoreductase subunit L
MIKAGSLMDLSSPSRGIGGMKTLILLIPLLPFIGFLINGLGRKYLSKGLVGAICSGTVLASFIISIMVFLRLDELSGKQITSNARILADPVVKYFDFINVGTLKIPFAFQVDQLTCVFLLIITGVGFLIHVYSTAYMHEEKREHFGRYFSYLNLFVF